MKAFSTVSSHKHDHSPCSKRVKKKLGTIYDHKVSWDRLETQHEIQQICRNATCRYKLQ